MRRKSISRHVIVGPADQYWLPGEIQLLALMLWKPPSPSRKNFGNNSAVCTPTLAEAAAKSRSAACTSGLRRNNSDGSPTGTSGGGAGIGAVAANSSSN